MAVIPGLSFTDNTDLLLFKNKMHTHAFDPLTQLPFSLSAGVLIHELAEYTFPTDEDNS